MGSNMALDQKAGRYFEITLKCDSRGNVGKKIASFFLKHPRIAKRFTFLLINNQPADLLVEIKDPKTNQIKTLVWEFKLDADLWSSLTSKRLEKEIVETYLPIGADLFYVWAIGHFDQQQLDMLIALIDEYYPHVRVKVYQDFNYAFNELLKLLVVNQWTKTVIIPVDYRMRNKSLITAISQLCNGITPELAEFMLTYEGYELDSLEKLILMNKTDAGKLAIALDEIFFVYYDEEQPALVQRFMAALSQKYIIELKEGINNGEN